MFSGNNIFVNRLDNSMFATVFSRSKEHKEKENSFHAFSNSQKKVCTSDFPVFVH